MMKQLALNILLAFAHLRADSLLVYAQDGDDDVRAVAAEALLPMASAVVEGEQATLRKLRNILWDILLTLEDLSLSTGTLTPTCADSSLLAVFQMRTRLLW